MGGAFAASPLCRYDEDATHSEIERAGWVAEQWVDRTAPGFSPADVTWSLICRIHQLWFSTTFPDRAGVQRREVVLNRKGTAVDPAAIIEGCENSCADWRYRLENHFPLEPIEQIAFSVTEANELVVRIYDIHPFVDGNTRATWSLRNFLLVQAGLYGLEIADYDRLKEAWWRASPNDHAQLDAVVLEALIEQDLRRAEHNRLLR